MRQKTIIAMVLVFTTSFQLEANVFQDFIGRWSVSTTSTSNDGLKFTNQNKVVVERLKNGVYLAKTYLRFQDRQPAGRTWFRANSSLKIEGRVTSNGSSVTWAELGSGRWSVQGRRIHIHFTQTLPGSDRPVSESITMTRKNTNTWTAVGTASGGITQKSTWRRLRK